MNVPTKNSTLLLVGPGMDGGGAENQFALMATELFAGRASVAFLTGKSSDVAAEDVARFYFLGWRGSLSYLRIIPRFWWLVWRGGYRVIFAFGLFPYLVAACATLGQRRKVRLIVSEITQPQKEDAIQLGIRRLAYHHLRRFAYRRAYQLTANSIDGVREMCAIASVAPEKGQRVMNIIDHERLRQRAAEPNEYPPPTARYFICVSRFDPMKRLDTVVTALALLPRHADADLLLVGDGPARAALTAQAVQLGLIGHVHFTGWLRNPAPLMQNATALILASEYEGFSNSILEAMFLDTPVITSLCSSDATDMCEQGAALGFAVGDAPALTVAMERLLTEQKTVGSLIDKARQYRQSHAMENSLPAYEKIIFAACDKAGA